MSVLDLYTSVKELPSLNMGLSNMSYDLVTSTRDVTNNTFQNGSISYKFVVSGNERWIPSRSYLKIRMKISRANLIDQLRLANNLAPTMNLCSALFQSLEFRINDKTVSKVSSFVPQVETLYQRMNKSKAFLDGCGQINFWNSDFTKRQADICIDGKDNFEEYNEIRTRADLGVVLMPAAATLAIAADSATIAVVNGPANLNTVFNVGDIIEIETGGATGLLKFNISLVNANSLIINNEKNIALAAGAYNFNRVRKVTKNARDIMNIEFIWTPQSLSIFQVTQALPLGNYELLLQPEVNFKKFIVESIVTDKVPGVDYDVRIDQMYLYVNKVQASRIEDLTYMLDLNTIRCQSTNVVTSSSQQKTYDVSPSTQALTVCYQDQRLGTDTRFSPTKFKSYNVNADASVEQKLKSFYVNYAGKQYPSPQADYKFDPNTDFTVQRYLDTQLMTGAYFDSGSCESLEDYQSRGAYTHIVCPRDGSDRSTRVTVNHEFDLTNPETENMKCLLFDHSKQVCAITIQNSRVVNVELEDV